MTLEDAIAIARDNDACEDELHEIERYDTWEEVFSHPDALFWVRWFVGYLPAGLHPARDAYHFRMRAARTALNRAYREDGSAERVPANYAFDAARKAASQALLTEIKKYLEVEDAVTLADGKTYGVKYYQTEPSL